MAELDRVGLREEYLDVLKRLRNTRYFPREIYEISYNQFDCYLTKQKNIIELAHRARAVAPSVKKYSS